MSPVISVGPIQSVQSSTSSQGPSQSDSQSTSTSSTTITDTVQLSNLAQQALQEATETYPQTLKEAESGDIQAQRLLAKEDAAAK